MSAHFTASVAVKKATPKDGTQQRIVEDIFEFTVRATSFEDAITKAVKHLEAEYPRVIGGV